MTTYVFLVMSKSLKIRLSGFIYFNMFLFKRYVLRERKRDKQKGLISDHPIRQGTQGSENCSLGFLYKFVKTGWARKYVRTELQSMHFYIDPSNNLRK